MALFPLQPGLYPLGQIDVIDASLASITGGEVMFLTSASRLNGAAESAAADALDGYNQATPGQRPAADLVGGVVRTMNFLADDGTSNYGTYFGEVIGTTAGLATTGTNLGPHTGAASGKVTLWDKDGLYEVTANSVAADFVTSLVNTAIAPGTSLGHNATSLLAHSACVGAVALSGVAHFVEYASSDTLVTTPTKLVGGAELFNRLKIHFHGGRGARAL